MRMNTPSHDELVNPVRGQRGFSLVEILMTVALLSVIILGLVAMFDQTRRAFTSSMTQVDVLEGGRAATALIASDLEQLTPCYASNNPALPQCQLRKFLHGCSVSIPYTPLTHAADRSK